MGLRKLPKSLVLAVAGALVLFMAPVAMAALPSTSNYQLDSYGFGSGGTKGSDTSNYSLEGISGELSGGSAASSAFITKPGFTEVQQANVPKVTLANQNNNYDKLHFTIEQQSNPDDALYALQVKAGDPACDFSTGTLTYVKSDNTLGSSLTMADYQTYDAWGGAGGGNIIGLASSTTYCLRAKATQGKFTESAYGPSASAATIGQQISFCLFTSASCAGGGNNESLGSLLAGTVITSGNIGVSFDTNANAGGKIYIYSANGGLKSTAAGGNTIDSQTADLSVAAIGFGARVTNSGQTSGGPFTGTNPYSGSGDNVGGIDTAAGTILSSDGPVTGGSAAIQLKAKASSTTPAANDYKETITIIAAASF